MLLSLIFASCGKISDYNVGMSQDEEIYDSLSACYNRARNYKDNGKALEALMEYKKCIQTDAPDSVGQAKIQPIIVESLLDMLNVYQMMGNSMACVKEFERMLKTPPTKTISNLCIRDLHVLYAYSIYLIDGREKEAEEVILTFLKQPLKGPKTYKDVDGKERNFRAERLFRDYSYAAAICYSDVTRQDDVVRWALKALDLSRECGGINGEQYIVSMLSSLYLKQGKMLDAIMLIEDAIDRSEVQKDSLSMVNSYNVLSRIYIDYDLLEQANESSLEGTRLLSKLRASNPSIALQCYLIRAKILFESGHRKQAYLWLDKAERIAIDLPYNSGKCDADYFRGVFMTKDTARVNIEKGIELLNKVTKYAGPGIKAKAYYFLARAYEKDHDFSRCEAMLDSLYTFSHKSNPPIYVKGASDFAINYYRSRGNLAMVARYASELQKEYEKYYSPKLVQQLSKDVMRKKTSSDAAEEMNRVYLQRMMYAGIAGVFLLIILGLVVLIMYNHSKFNHQMGRIRNIYEADRREKDELIKRLQSANENGDNISELLQSAKDLTNDDNITRFENLFVQIHPNFDKHLSELIPNIGKRERMLCQLIFLEFSSAQIAQSMGVAARSITIYRYRIRQKMNIKEQSLDEVLKNLE